MLESPFLFSFDGLSWNPSGTKAVILTPCAEGCPNDFLVGYDLETGESTALQSGWDASEELRDQITHVEWINDDTASVLGIEYDI